MHRYSPSYCAGGREQSLPSTTSHLDGSISAPEVNYVFLFHGATLLLRFHRRREHHCLFPPSAPYSASCVKSMVEGPTPSAIARAAA